MIKCSLCKKDVYDNRPHYCKNLKKGNIALSVFTCFLLVLMYTYGIAGILNDKIRDEITTNANSTTLTNQIIIFSVPFFLIIIIASYWWFIKGDANLER